MSYIKLEDAKNAIENCIGEQTVSKYATSNECRAVRHGADLALFAICDVPTADVVAVVRCRDCKHWEHEGTDYLTQRPFGACKCEYWEHPTGYFNMLDNDYCSYGERSENGT